MEVVHILEHAIHLSRNNLKREWPDIIAVDDVPFVYGTTVNEHKAVYFKDGWMNGREVEDNEEPERFYPH